jgi:hypothetical protein
LKRRVVAALRIAMRRTLGAAALLLAGAASGALPPTVTIVEGPSTIVSGAAAFAPAAGVRLNTCDIVHTGPKSLVQVELEDGTQIVLGPESRFVFDVPGAGAAAADHHFLIAGWAKFTVPKRDKGAPYRIDTPHFGMQSDAGVTVLRAGANDGEFFVEQGGAAALVPAAAGTTRVLVPAGRTFTRRSGSDRGAVSERARAAFVNEMPPAFRDSLPSLLANLKARSVQPRPATGYNAADAAAWLRAVPGLHGCVGNVTVREAQQALESRGFAVGPIDGIVGRRTRAALQAFQQKQGLAPSAELDAPTLRALDVVDRR